LRFGLVRENSGIYGAHPEEDSQPRVSGDEVNVPSRKVPFKFLSANDNATPLLVEDLRHAGIDVVYLLCGNLIETDTDKTSAIIQFR